MLLDIAQPAALLLSILALYATFHAAFLTTATSVADRAEHAVLRLAFAAAISLLAGLLFRERALDTETRFDADFTANFPGFTAHTTPPSRSTLPVRLFCWATIAMTTLFALSWYLETYVAP